MKYSEGYYLNQSIGCSGPTSQILKASLKRIKLFPSNLISIKGEKFKNSYKNTKVIQCKIHNVWHQMKNHKAYKEQTNITHNKEKQLLKQIYNYMGDAVSR